MNPTNNLFPYGVPQNPDLNRQIQPQGQVPINQSPIPIGGIPMFDPTYFPGQQPKTPNQHNHYPQQYNF